MHYPLPTVRALERDLRKNIDENRSKLRSLVGASYRDLLGTAERIMEMDGQMKTLELGLGDMGRRCDARMLERSGGNWAGMRKRRGRGQDDGMAVMAQTKVLQGCLTAVGRVVKGRGDALLGAKVLVLARLLAKGIGESGQAPAIMGELKKQLVGLRKRLLAYVERSMTKAGTDKTVLANTLCAYALVTSSTPRQVLRHFLQVRFRQLEAKADSPAEGEVMEMLDLYSRTLLDTKDLFPRRFADALSQLAKMPLLRDPQVHACYELSLDIHGQWIAEDVRSFTPWVRHAQVTSGEVGDALASWTKQAHGCLLSGLEEYLEQQTDLSAVVDSRHAVLSKFMALSGRLRNDHHAGAIENIRETFLKRMNSLVAASANLAELDVACTDSTDRTPFRQDILWDLAKRDLDLSAGAHAFRRTVIRHRHGRDTPLDSQVAKLDAWVKRIEQSVDCIDTARSRKWDDDLDFDIDDLDDGDALLDTLSKRDPTDMTTTLSSSVEAAVSAVSASIEACGESATRPAHVLRVRRELDMRVRQLQARLTLSAAEVSLQTLHKNLGLSVSRQAIDDYTAASQDVSHVATTLWDGTPPLPMQPAPAVFKFLSALHRAMTEAGDDLWSAECVVELRKVADEKLGQMVLPGESSSLTNGHGKEGEDGEEDGAGGAEATQSPSRDFLLQSLFDRLYLQHVFPLDAAAAETSSHICAAIAALTKRAAIDEPSQQRMRKSAEESWRRTYLLFGLLAN